MGTATLPELGKRMVCHFNALSARIAYESADGLNDDAKGAEIQVRDIMNTLWGFNLQLEERVNAKGFDLCDKDHKVLVQVTCNLRDSKVESCLKKTCERVSREPQLKDSRLYIFFLSTDDTVLEKLRANAKEKMTPPPDGQKQSLKPYDFTVSGITFEPDRHMINFNAFIKCVRDSRITSAQLERLEDYLNKFATPVYLVSEIVKQFPHMRTEYVVNSDTLCLRDVRNMLECEENDWAEELRIRFGRQDVPLPPACRCVMTGYDSDEEFLNALMPKYMMEDIYDVVVGDMSVINQIMCGNCPSSLLKQLSMSFLQDSGIRYRQLMDACKYQFNMCMDLDQLFFRVDFMLNLIDGPASMGILSISCREIDMHEYPYYPLALLLYYALFGKTAFEKLKKKYAW